MCLPHGQITLHQGGGGVEVGLEVVDVVATMRHWLNPVGEERLPLSMLDVLTVRNRRTIVGLHASSLYAPRPSSPTDTTALTPQANSGG